MLSNTKGYSRFSRVLGSRRDELSALDRVCEAWRTTGRCKAYNKEQEIRRTIAAAKEAELLKNAVALYNAQMDLVADLGGLDGDAELLESLTTSAGGAGAHGGFSTDPSKKDEMIGKLVAELKQEPAYLNWSLDAAVAERMVELHVRPCRYTHRGELAASLKRTRSAQTKVEAELHQEQDREQQATLRSDNAGDVQDALPEATTSLTHSSALTTTTTSITDKNNDSAISARERQWEQERHRIFQSLTPLQRCVVCLLWQRQYTIEQGLITDVRLMLEKRLTESFERTGRVVVDGVVVAAAAAQQHPGGKDDDGIDNEDPLDAFLSSAAFESLVERESHRVVTRVVFRPELGLVDLSALPLLVAHMSCTPTSGVLLARTLTYFTGKTLTPVNCGGATDEGEDGDTRPAPTNFHHLLFPTRTAITEKEIDLGGAARADEVIEALEWVLQVYQREGQLLQHATRRPGWRSTTWSCPTNASSTTHNNASVSCSNHVSALFRHERVRLHGLTLTHCKITSADALISALCKRHLETFLYALDLADNRLWSLRFILLLRAHFAQRLLRLSLKSNPITRKPDYQAQVRQSLPQLTSLDGEPIRRPPLRLPKPLPSSCTLCPRASGDAHPAAHNRTSDPTSGASHHHPPQKTAAAAAENKADKEEAEQETTSAQRQEEEQAAVLDCVGRLLYIWETRRIPRTARELAAQHDAAGRATTRRPEEEPEEDWNEDNFPHRYLHPAATFSLALSPTLHFFNAAVMRDARTVELDDAYTGMRLSAVDVRDARVFDVAMQNSSRNLLAGRPALQRFGKGAENCFLAYQLTLYPERMVVEHHVRDAVVSVARLAEVSAQATVASAGSASATTRRSKKLSKGGLQQHQQQPPARFGALTCGRAPTQHVVTLHGLMTWRLPSMKANECMRACYSRVMIFTKKVLPAQNREWERLRSPPYVLMNDEVFLYPAPQLPSSPSSSVAALMPSALYHANSPARLARLVVEFGLEACRDGTALVRDVMERATCPASEYAALQALVLGVVGPRKTAAATATVTAAAGDGAALAGEDVVAFELARAAAVQLIPILQTFITTASPEASSASSSSAATRSYIVFSVLEGGEAAVAAAGGSTAPWETARTEPDSSTTSLSRGHPPAKKAKKARAHSGNDGATVVDVERPSSLSQPSQQQQEETEERSDLIRTWAAGPHRVTRSLLHDITTVTNACYTSL